MTGQSGKRRLLPVKAPATRWITEEVEGQEHFPHAAGGVGEVLRREHHLAEGLGPIRPRPRRPARRPDPAPTPAGPSGRRRWRGPGPPLRRHSSHAQRLAQGWRDGMLEQAAETGHGEDDRQLVPVGQLRHILHGEDLLLRPQLHAAVAEIPEQPVPSANACAKAWRVPPPSPSTVIARA